MLRRVCAFWSAIVVVQMLVLLPPPAAAAGQEPNPCKVDMRSVECWRWLEQNAPDERDDGPSVCAHHSEIPESTRRNFASMGVALGERRVPCSHPRVGWWLGGEFGCWARTSADPALPPGPPQPPPGTSLGPLQLAYNAEPNEGGAWYELSCLTMGMWGPVWLNTPPGADLDPEALALRARAELPIQEPLAQVSPPESGSVPLGMPVWLAVDESPRMWGPLSNQACDGPLCVSITARVARAEWRMGDGSSPVVCDRGQNVVWRPGLEFLQPGSACHHFYTSPSRDLDNSRYEVTVIAHWVTFWTGGGQSGVLDSTQETTVSFRVDEIEVLVRQ